VTDHSADAGKKVEGQGLPFNPRCWTTACGGAQRIEHPYFARLVLCPSCGRITGYHRFPRGRVAHA